LPTLVRDVQFWLDEPNRNFGWVLLSRDEDKPETARRFASREDPANTPMLTIEFTTGSNELRLTAINVDSSQVTLSWIGGIGPFQAQGRPSLSLPWEDIGTPVAAASVELPLFGRMGFFRIRQATNVPGSPPPGSTNTPPDEPPPPSSPPPADSAEYEIVFKSDWSPATHPQSFPLGAHWSPLIGGTHNTNVTFWQEGVVATQGIEDVAELGNIVALRREVNTAITNGTANALLTRPGSISPSSSAAITFTAQRDFPLVTLVTMIAPSPDWFTGVHGLSLIENGQWMDQKVVVLDLYDAGTDSGVTYSSLDANTQPREVIRKITGFPALVNGQLVPFGTFTFTRR
jgi:hypothetical protein